MTSGVRFRVQNNRDCFYCHVSDDDYDMVKHLRLKIAFVGANIILRRHPTAATFTNRWGRDNDNSGYVYALKSKYAHPFFPLFGPFECEGDEDASGNLYIQLPGVLELPWPSKWCSKYEFDDASCEKLLNDRINALRGAQMNCLPIPDYMAVFIGYERLAKVIKANPWLDIVRC